MEKQFSRNMLLKKGLDKQFPILKTLESLLTTTSVLHILALATEEC